MYGIALRKVTKKLGETVAVDGVDLEIRHGELVSLLGPAGSGKTTMLRLLAGWIDPDSGSIVVDGKALKHLPPERKRIGMLHQSYSLIPRMSVAEFIMFALEAENLPKPVREARLAEVLCLVGLEGLEDRRPYQLSPGQKQRVILAKAVALHPRVLLLDEPLSALDAGMRPFLLSEIRRIQSVSCITTVYATGSMEEALSVSDRIVTMQRGRVIRDGVSARLSAEDRATEVLRASVAGPFVREC